MAILASFRLRSRLKAANAESQSFLEPPDISAVRLQSRFEKNEFTELVAIHQLTAYHKIPAATKKLAIPNRMVRFF